MCLVAPFTYPIMGERLERLKERNADGSVAFPDDWAQSIRQESPALRRRLKHLLRRQRDVESDAEDALQRTWLLALQKIGPSYSRPELHRSYLFHLARGAASEVMRKGGREQLVGGDQGDVDSSVLDWLVASSTDDDRALRQRLEELLDVAQPQLSETERKIVLLHWFEDQTFAEIAVALDLRPGTVATAYYRALEKLRHGLAADD